MSEKMAEKKDEDESERGKWRLQREFVFAVAGGVVGVGNVWRFPYLCYKNGGGTFLIPYFLFLITCGIPLFVLEITLGQFMSRGGIFAWNLAPAFKGVGYCAFTILIWTNIYYVVILAWTLHYLINSVFHSELPWISCGNWWNTDCCSTEFQNGSIVRPANCSADVSYPEQEYWSHRVLQVTDEMTNVGGMQWELVGTLLLAWIICYGCIFRGVKSTGKTTYVTASFPILMMVILLIRGVTLPGASNGIYYFLRPNLERLKDSNVWLDAGTQVLWSYLIGLGALTSLGSYNKYSYNSLKWSLFLVNINFTASMLSGFVIFSVLGYMANQLGTTVDEVAESGPGLVFIAYPKALSLMPGAKFWAFLFFAMLAMVGLASEYVAVEGMCTMIFDLFPKLGANKKQRPIVIGIICFVLYLLGLTMVTKGGIYIFVLCDKFGASGLCMLWTILFECLVIGWIYGKNEYFRGLYHMFGHKLDVRKWPWQILGYLWKYISPCFIVFIMVYYIGAWTGTSLGSYHYSIWGELVGLAMAASSMIWIPGYLIFKLFKSPGFSISEKWHNATKPIYPESHPYLLEGDIKDADDDFY